ncbi:hypothetical protein [Gloeothece verrucosa]|uniref:Uncharacterized protein n=1 Tax=Gloeothece verrucosa (strain PCC 7822) TaxID=497965 RepID=E0UCY6_GLOV7|nr:hypothetical protein [Gloeothece verrucosa]ADN16451.1 hypothetical protein Cyan7822_4541 [Gloeothece verrucosa PCC 7822]
MTKLTIGLGAVILGIGLWGCSNVSNQMTPPMTQVTVQICGEQLVRNKIEEDCLSNTGVYWGEVTEKDIKLVGMARENKEELDYYFVVVSAAGCVADWAAPRAKATEIVAINSMYSGKFSGQTPKIKKINLVQVKDEKRKLLVEETKEKLAFATLMGSQSTYTQQTCQNFKQFQHALKLKGYEETVY